MIWFRKRKQSDLSDRPDDEERVKNLLLKTKEAESLVNQYGAVLESVSDAMYGSPITLLPRSKQEIKSAILKYLFFLDRTKNLDSGTLDVLKAGYMNLATFIEDDEAEVAAAAQEAFRSCDPRKIATPVVDRAVEKMSRINAEMADLASEFDSFLGTYEIEAK